MPNLELCPHCHQTPTWLKEKALLKAKIKKRNLIIKQQDQQIKQLKELNWKLRNKSQNQRNHGV